MGDLDIFIGGLIAGQIFSNSYHVDSVQQYFPSYSDDGARYDGLLMLLLFHAGGVFASLVNAFHPRCAKAKNKKLDWARWLMLWAAFAAWLSGNIAVGYSYSIADLQQLSANNTASETLIAKLYTDRILSFVLIDTGGGIFFWGALGLSLQRSKGYFRLPPKDILLNLTAGPIFALLINACFTSILAENGGYFYLNRIIAVSAVVACILRLFLFSPEVVNEDDDSLYRSELKSSWGAGALIMASACLAASFMYLPFAVLPFVPGTAATPARLEYLFGGLLMGATIGALLLSTNIEDASTGKKARTVPTWLFLFFARLHDVCAAGAAVAITIILNLWGTSADLVKVLFLGSSIGMLLSWYLYQATRKQAGVRVTTWMLAYTSVTVIGIGASLTMVNLEWTTEVPLSVRALAAAHTGVLLLVTMGGMASKYV